MFELKTCILPNRSFSRSSSSDLVASERFTTAIFGALRVGDKKFLMQKFPCFFTDTFVGGPILQLQIQNRAAKRSNFHDEDISVGISAENLSLQIQLLS